jgi:hypothetical protein
MSIDATYKTPWLEKLRDEESRQTRGCLYNPQFGQCCLGVLCDVIVQDQLIPGAHWNDDDSSAEFALPYEQVDLEGGTGEDVFFSTTEIPYNLQQQIPGWEYGEGGTLPCTWDDLREMFPAEVEAYVTKIREAAGNAILGIPTLVRLNDDVCLSFKQIAEVIEKWL